MKKKLITLMLITSLTLGVSVQAFATTDKQITPQNNLVSNSTNTVTTMPVKNPIESSLFNYGPNGGSSADSIIAGGGVIQIGDVGLAVKDVQSLLVQRHFLSTVDGYFGQSTKTAVVNYQKSLQSANISLNADGIVGSVTWSWLRIVG